MIRIIGSYKGRREVLDWTPDRGEADRLVREYGMAYRDWSISTTDSANQTNVDAVLTMRRAGRTHGEIAAAIGVTRHYVDILGKHLVDEGVVDRRKAGSQERLTDRNEAIIAARRAGLTVPQIAEKFGLTFFNAQGILYKLRKQGRL